MDEPIKLVFLDGEKTRWLCANMVEKCCRNRPCYWSCIKGVEEAKTHKERLAVSTFLEITIKNPCWRIFSAVGYYTKHEGLCSDFTGNYLCEKIVMGADPIKHIFKSLGKYILLWQNEPFEFSRFQSLSLYYFNHLDYNYTIEWLLTPCHHCLVKACCFSSKTEIVPRRRAFPKITLPEKDMTATSTLAIQNCYERPVRMTSIKIKELCPALQHHLFDVYKPGMAEIIMLKHEGTMWGHAMLFKDVFRCFPPR